MAPVTDCQCQGCPPKPVQPMVDNLSGCHIVQGLQRQAITLLLLGKPCRKRLFDNPAPGAFQAGGHLVDFISHK